jgi:hypothetical protein
MANKNINGNQISDHRRIAGGMDMNGVTYKIDVAVFKSKLRNATDRAMTDIIEQGVRQFLGLDEAPTSEMIDFLKSVGILTTRSTPENDEAVLIHS